MEIVSRDPGRLQTEVDGIEEKSMENELPTSYVKNVETSNQYSAKNNRQFGA